MNGNRTKGGDRGFPSGRGRIKRAALAFFLRTLLLVAASGLLSGCARQFIPKSSGAASTIYMVGQENDLAHRFAPAFYVYESDIPDNRIGMPSVRVDGHGSEDIFIDPDRPVIYAGEFTFATAKGVYTNLVYRLHFARVGFSHITAGNNGGLLVVVTLNAKQQPVLVSTLGTCGCYLAITPTSFLPDSALPAGFCREAPLRVYGETLPGSLDYRGTEHPLLLVFVRPDVHRVMDLAVVSRDSLQHREAVVKKTGLAVLDDLERLAVPGSTKTTSFFYESGLMKGYVKGALKPWELVFLSGPALDLFVGMDKAYYGDPKQGLPMYTSLKPWARKDSDLRDYGRFLSYWGWRL